MVCKYLSTYLLLTYDRYVNHNTADSGQIIMNLSRPAMQIVAVIFYFLCYNIK